MLRNVIASKIYNLITCMAILLSPCIFASDRWAPKPNFTIDNSSYKETLTFISGVAYALHFSYKESENLKLEKLYCLPKNEDINSKFIIQLLNSEIKGDVEAEFLMEVLMIKLKKEYPC